METRVLAALADGRSSRSPSPRPGCCSGSRREGSRLTDLAAQAQVTKQTAGELVDQLERRGYVERVPDPSRRPGAA